MATGMVSVYSLMAVFFFESIMFPTIFALGVKNLGIYTKKGASYIIMSIVGGALPPPTYHHALFQRALQFLADARLLLPPMADP